MTPSAQGLVALIAIDVLAREAAAARVALQAGSGLLLALGLASLVPRRRRAPSTEAPPEPLPRHRLHSIFWRQLAWSGLRHLPPPLRHASTPVGAGLAWLLLPEQRHAVERNLRRVLGDAGHASDRARSFGVFARFARHMAEAHLAHFRPSALEPAVRGRARFDAAFSVGRGAILVTGHVGAWSLAPFMMERVGLPPATFVMAPEPDPRAHAAQARLRRRWNVVYAGRSPYALVSLAGVLHRGGLVCMQLDRPGGRASGVPFFGGEAQFSTAPALLARATGAPLLPVFMRRVGDAFVVSVEPAVWIARTADAEADVAAATAALVARYQAEVARDPLEWFQFHDFWEPPP